MIFEIDNIELNLGGKRILNGIYIKTEKGRITGILGPNGSGKSSLLNVFFGGLQPLHKLIRINGTAYLKPLFKSGLVKYLPQHSVVPAYIRSETLFNLYKVDWQGFIMLFPEFGQYKNFFPRQLSGGQQRTIETYLSIKSPAELLLLDEPFTHLSPVYIERLLLLLQEEKKKKAIIITDHLYQHILETADDLYLLKNSCSKYIRDSRELQEYQYLNAKSL